MLASSSMIFGTIFTCTLVIGVMLVCHPAIFPIVVSACEKVTGEDSMMVVATTEPIPIEFYASDPSTLALTGGVFLLSFMTLVHIIYYRFFRYLDGYEEFLNVTGKVVMPSHTRPLVFGCAIMIMSTFLFSVLLVFSSASLPIAQSLEDEDFDDSPVDVEDMAVDEAGIVQEYPYYFSRLTRAVVGGLIVMTFGFLTHMGYYCDRRDEHDVALKVGMPPSTSTSTYYAYGIVIICTLFLASVFLVSSHHSITGNPEVDNAEAPAPVFVAKTTVANSSLIAGNETTKTLIQNVTADTTVS
ncbi:hypothetical protein CAEBREN_19562 [Caenorhabditis brenneri]|uniref:Uncharacterized protein n=1 Tax=Caenorhabditis brenneri TaxID=135651 RepID=G0P445_CAEBE|nr:hypothetical protein CAEBREN_19562 [Caenorhabditis brenneri]